MSLGEEVLATTVIWLGLAVAGGLAGGVLWQLAWRGRGPLLPRRRPWRPAPWGGLEVFCLFLVVFVLPLGILRLLNHPLGPPDRDEEALRDALAQAVAVPAQLGIVFFFLWKVRHVRPFQLGFHAGRLAANVTLGYLAWLAVTPLVYGVDVLTRWIYEEAHGSAPEEHPLLKLVRAEQPALAWALLWFLTVVAAPLVEEVMFRGLIQGWFLSRSWGGHVGMVLALLLSGDKPDEPAWERRVFVLALLPPYLLLPLVLGRRAGAPAPEAVPPAVPPVDGLSPVHREGEPAARAGWAERFLDAVYRAAAEPRVCHGWAIYAAAAIFAVVHPWPTPVPLFPLGLGLGWLAYRTRSLVGPMTLHALFNAVACLTAVWENVW
jgi:membrane protease YdiL (CAAX protease family)